LFIGNHRPTPRSTSFLSCVFIAWSPALAQVPDIRGGQIPTLAPVVRRPFLKTARAVMPNVSVREGRPYELHAGRWYVVKQRRSEEELRQMMLAAARKLEECSELEDLFIFGPTPRPDANWGFGIAGKDNKVSVACYTRLNQIAGALQEKYELHPIKAARCEIEARVWSLIHDHPTLKASLSSAGVAGTTLKNAS
jgi:hypothetical protein